MLTLFPKFTPFCLLLMQSALKLNFKFPPPPLGNLPNFIKVSFYCCSLNTKLGSYSQRILSAAHSHQFNSSCHFRYCTLHLGNRYKNGSGHRTVTSLNFTFPPVMINTRSSLTTSPLIYLLLSFILKGIRCGPTP